MFCFWYSHNSCQSPWSWRCTHKDQDVNDSAFDKPGVSFPEFSPLSTSVSRSSIHTQVYQACCACSGCSGCTFNLRSVITRSEDRDNTPRIPEGEKHNHLLTRVGAATDLGACPLVCVVGISCRDVIHTFHAGSCTQTRSEAGVAKICRLEMSKHCHSGIYLPFISFLYRHSSCRLVAWQERRCSYPINTHPVMNLGLAQSARIPYWGTMPLHCCSLVSQ